MPPFRLGGRAFISSRVAARDLGPAIRIGVELSAFHPVRGPRGGRRAPGGLSRRELEVVARLAHGRTNAQIAADLGLSESTVRFHLRNAFRRLGVRNRTEAARWALGHDVV